MIKAMRFGITWKILSAVFLTALVVVCGMLFLVQWSFDRGFLEYVNRIERETQQNFIDTLAQEYEKYGNWEFITDNSRHLRELYFRSFLQSEAGRARFGSDAPVLARSPGRRGRHTGKPFKSKIALLDENKRVLAGTRRVVKSFQDNPDHTALLPVDVDGKTVGYLAVTPKVTLSHVHDLRFSSHLERAFLFIAALMLIVSLVLALPVARRLVRPVKELTGTTRELAAGNYNIRSRRYGNDELGELARNFNALAETLKRNETARQQWIADISHELRTPISILRGEIEALQDGIREYSTERVASLHQEIINLGRLVDDLHELSMSDIGALDYRKQDLSLTPVLDECLGNYAARFAGKNINISCVDRLSETDLVFADAGRLQQLFNNLLNNSLNYTDENGSLKVELDARDEYIRITLEDSAPGVSDADLPRLFERLFRVESSRNRAKGGSGLGLAICRNIVEAHDGSITAAQSPLGGLKIIMDLPKSWKNRTLDTDR